MKILKLYPQRDIPTNHNYAINYGMWDHIPADRVILEQAYGLNFDSYDFVLLPMRKRWAGHGDLLSKIKESSCKAILFDNDSCYSYFDSPFYEGIDYIYYRCPDKAGKIPANGSYLGWSIDTEVYQPMYGGKGVLFSCGVSETIYPLRYQIKTNVRGLVFNYKAGAGYIENIQQAGAAIVTNSKPTPVVPAKLIEFASCGTEIVANHCQYLDYYFPENLIRYFETTKELQDIVNSYKPNIAIQKELRRITEEQHDDKVRAREILNDLKGLEDIWKRDQVLEEKMAYE